MADVKTPAVNDPDKVEAALADKGSKESKVTADTTTKAEAKADTKAIDDRTQALIAEGVGPNEAKARAEVEADQAARDEKDRKDTADKRAKISHKDLTPAGESGDPEVQRLLAQRQAHMTNLADLVPVPDQDAVKLVQAAVQDIDDRLADLGYRAS
jgi:hypothetical protein